MEFAAPRKASPNPYVACLSSCHVELPGDAVRAFEGDITLTKCFVELHARVLDSRRRERLGDPLQLGRIRAGERDVIQSNAEWVEDVSRGGAGSRPAPRDRGG